MSQDYRAELVRVCRRVGERIPYWTQGAGGNISVKDGDRLWIKATGTRLDSVGPDRGVAELDRPALCRALTALSPADEVGYADAIHKSTRGTQRPSMESGFHALLPKRWVLHFHSLTAIVMADLARSNPGIALWMKRTRLKRVCFVHPGLALTEALRSTEGFDYYVLENHGVVLQTDHTPDSWDGILEDWNTLEREFCVTFGFPTFLHGEPPSEGMPEFTALDAPWREYFPDAAVFADRIRASLTAEASGKSDPHFRWNPAARDRDAAELWHALALLHLAHPTLPALPAESTDVIRELPTEQLRQKA